MNEKGLVIIIAFNNAHLTKHAVRTALSQDMPVDVLVVNNHSLDGTADWLKTKQVATVTFSSQISLAACWNRALKLAWIVGFEHALVLNNDVEVRPDTYRLLLAHGGPFVTCVSVDDPARLGAAGDRTIEELRPKAREHPDYSAFLIRKQVMEKVGWFNEAYLGGYGEDAEFHVRCHRKGVKSVCIDVPFLHHGAATVKSASPGEAARIRRNADTNRERFKREYGAEIGSKEYYELFE
jgi:GT2 family glycosyltransferase